MEKLLYLTQSISQIFAVVSGMWVQFWFVDKEKKNRKIFYTIFISSTFVALYIIPATIDIVNMALGLSIKYDGNIAILLYASSSLISMELMSVIIYILPKGAKNKLTKFLEVEDDITEES